VFEAADRKSPWHILQGALKSDSFSMKEKLQILRLGLALRKEPDADGIVGKLVVSDWLSDLGQGEKLQRNFWNLLCIAALNEDPAIACAGLFQRVLHLALFTSPEDSRIGIPRVGLSDCYTQAATAYIEARGGQVQCGGNATNILITDGVCRGVKLMSGETLEAGALVSAVPWYQLGALLPWEVVHDEPYFACTHALRPTPIISINLWFDRPVTDLDFVGLRGTTIQWLFNKGKILGTDKNYVSLVLSGAHQHIGRTKDDLLRTALDELGELLPETREATLLHWSVLKERFATFSPSCEVEIFRPGAITPVQRLFLAGDWTATGLPATIEGAVQSGYTAASAVLGQT
jgi:zeta-carotene desaturase